MGLDDMWHVNRLCMSWISLYNNIVYQNPLNLKELMALPGVRTQWRIRPCSTGKTRSPGERLEGVDHYCQYELECEDGASVAVLLDYNYAVDHVRHCQNSMKKFGSFAPSTCKGLACWGLSITPMKVLLRLSSNFFYWAVSPLPGPHIDTKVTS